MLNDGVETYSPEPLEMVLPEPKHCSKCGKFPPHANEGAVLGSKTYTCGKCGDVTDLVRQWQMQVPVQQLIQPSYPMGCHYKLEVPPEIKRFSWAAWFFNWIWALARGLWGWGFGLFAVYFVAYTIIWIPIVGFFVSIPLALLGLVGCFVLGFTGNVADWQHYPYASVAEFRQSHRRWEITMKIIGGTLIVLLLLAIILGTWLPALQKIAPG